MGVQECAKSLRPIHLLIAMGLAFLLLHLPFRANTPEPAASVLELELPQTDQGAIRTEPVSAEPASDQAAGQAPASPPPSCEQNKPTPTTTTRAGSSLFGDHEMASRLLARVCPNTDAVKQMKRIREDDVMAQVKLLAKINTDCPQSQLPFAARELWPHFTDTAIFHQEGKKQTHDDKAAVARCLQREEKDRACIVFVHTQVMRRVADAIHEYLEDHPEERIVAISSSNVDECVPFSGYDMDSVTGTDGRASAPGFMRMLEHPRFLMWFGENPCMLHPKLRALPIGPKFKWRETAFGPEKEPYLPTKVRLMNMIEKAVSMDREERERRMLVAVLTGSSTLTAYKTIYNIRAKFLNHMLAVARDAQGEPARSVPVEKYADTLIQHRFVWSPPGVGLDSHRFWEALMAGAVPVVLRTTLSPMYRDMQVLEVDHFGSVNQALLDHTWETQLAHEPQHWLSPKVFAFYWLHQIYTTAGSQPRAHRQATRDQPSLRTVEPPAGTVPTVHEPPPNGRPRPAHDSPTLPRRAGWARALYRKQVAWDGATE